MEQEINLDEITDMNLLQNLVSFSLEVVELLKWLCPFVTHRQLDQTEDIDDRKAIRGRIQELRAIERGKLSFFC